MQKEPFKPIPASTVILARQKNKSLQVYLIRRNVCSGFMGGMFAFPGGKVDPVDDHFEIWEKYLDMDPEQIQIRLGGKGLPLRKTTAFCIAAIRETLEEAGVLFAHKNHRTVDDFESIALLRMAENLSADWFKEQVLLKHWALDFKALSRWSHWITPEAMKYRYDTRFFVAALPHGQACLPDTREAVQGIWINPKKGLLANLEGDIPLSPPTLVTLHELLKFNHLHELLDNARHREWGETRLPRMVRLKKGTVIVEPWDPMYHEKNIKIKKDNLEQNLLLPGEPFSRIWNNGSLCRPIRVR